MLERTKLNLSQMNDILLGIEYGYKQCEKGHNLQAALASAFELFEVVKPAASREENQENVV